MFLEDGGCEGVSRICAEGGGVLLGHGADDMILFAGGDIWFVVGAEGGGGSGRESSRSSTASMGKTLASDIGSEIVEKSWK